MEPITSTLLAAGKLAETAVSSTEIGRIGRLAVGRLGFKALAEADPEVVHPLALSLSALGGATSALSMVSKLSFTGLAKAERIADIQDGPVCWAEAAENIVQLMKGDGNGILNNLSDNFQKKVAENLGKFDASIDIASDGCPVLRFPRHSYPALLRDMGIEAKSIPFSHEALQKALSENRPAILSGTVNSLPEKYPVLAESTEAVGHAVVAIDFDPRSGEYTILDSNYPQPYTLSSEAVGRFMQGESSRLCITKSPAEKWRHTTAYTEKSKIVFSVGEKASSIRNEASVAKIGDKPKPVSFGANTSILQASAELSKTAERIGTASLPGRVLGMVANVLSGTNRSGMEVIREAANDAAAFYKISPPKTFFDNNELGASWGGKTEDSFDDWVGGNPSMLRQYAKTYGGDFIKAVFGHEIGHHMFTKLGLRKAGYPKVCNEAVADFLSGLYCGARGLDGRGFAEFLANDTSSLRGGYPTGATRSALFKEGYSLANSYAWKDFQSILDERGFNLKAQVTEIAKRQLALGVRHIEEGEAKSSLEKLSSDKKLEKYMKKFRAMSLEDKLKEVAKTNADIRKAYLQAGGFEGEMARKAEEFRRTRENIEKWIENMGRQLAGMDEEQIKSLKNISRNNLESTRQMVEDEREAMEFRQKMAELREQQIKQQTQFQYEAEKKGYRQLFPNTIYQYSKDPNLFSKGGYIYRLNPYNGSLNRI